MNEPLILKVNKDLNVDDLKNIEEALKGLENVIILPKGMEVVRRDLGYRVFTKEAYKEHVLSKGNPPSAKGFIKGFDERWERMSKGHNFIIGVGKDELMFYSVEYFDKKILGGTSNE